MQLCNKRIVVCNTELLVKRYRKFRHRKTPLLKNRERDIKSLHICRHPNYCKRFSKNAHGTANFHLIQRLHHSRQDNHPLRLRKLLLCKGDSSLFRIQRCAILHFCFYKKRLLPSMEMGISSCTSACASSMSQIFSLCRTS